MVDLNILRSSRQSLKLVRVTNDSLSGWKCKYFRQFIVKNMMC